MDILLILGIAISGGFLGAKLFRAIKIPQVVGYIIIGVILGVSGAKVFTLDLIDKLSPINNFALALIGFMIGKELHLSTFKKLGKSILTILIFEALGAFLLVTLFVTLLTHRLYEGLIFGALSSATAPAATVDVLWEYKAKGPLTTTLLAIVGLDDALALIIYGFASSFAFALLTHQSPSFANMLWSPLLKILLSLLIGGSAGSILGLISKRLREKSQLLPISLGVILLVAGFSHQHRLSLILSSMAVGVFLINLAPHASKNIFGAIESFAPPVYILFFVLVGSRLQIGLLPKMGMLGLLYLIGRSTGKIVGATLGAKISHAYKSVQKYLGITLFSQAGVAIGLAIAVYQEFSHLIGGRTLGVTVINVITATTFVVQIIGPPLVKIAIVKAKEAKAGV